MKNLLLVACLAAVLSWAAAYPVIRIGRVPIATRVSIPVAVRMCGWNARCLLNQEIIGIEDEEVQRQYSAVIQLAILHELSGLVGHPADSSEVPADSSSEETPEVVPRRDDTEIFDPDTRGGDTTEIQDPEDRSGSDDVPVGHRIRVVTIHHPFGIRRVILITPITGVADSDESENVPVKPDSSDSEDVPAKPDSSDESKGSTPDAGTPSPTPAAAPEVTTTEMTNSIERSGRGSTTESSEEERRESMGGSDEETDQVEVFDPKKPARITGEDRFKYKAVIPEIRQV